MQLTKNFSLIEFLRSQTATRKGGEMLAAQMNPPARIVDNLRYLSVNTLQPLRTLLRTPFTISSGYRSPELNSHVGGSAKSQHMQGEAADIIMFGAFFDEDRPVQRRIHTILNNRIYDTIGRTPRKDCNANFYLFAAASLYLAEIDIDQVIHEYGSPGKPEWVHLASSRERNKREILLIAKGQRNKLTLEEALELGC